jgi:hypothetical protein
MRAIFILLVVFYLCIIAISEAAPTTAPEEVTVQVENQLSRRGINRYKKRSYQNKNIKSKIIY